MKKLTTLTLMVLICGAVWGQWAQTGNTISTTSNEVILNSGNKSTSTLWLSNKNSGPTNAKGNYYIKAFDWWGATLHFVGTGDDNNERLNVTFDGKVGIGTTNIHEKLSLFDNGTNQVTTQYCNKNTGVGKGNGFIVGIEKAGNGVVWNRENHYIRFGTNATERMRITDAGYVGIGTTEPQSKLDVNGSFKSNTLKINAPNSTDDWNTIWQCGFFDAYQKMNAPDSYNWYWGINLGHRSNNSGYRFGGQILIKNHPSEPVMYFRSRGKEGNGIWAKVLHNKGNQRIEGNLTVNGIFNSEEVKVETIAANNITYTANGNTADFVFEDNYHLKDLSEVEAFIKTNKHLPEIPSAADMEEAGVNLAEMNKLLLMKVEELTLYAIQQQAEAERLKAEVEEVRSTESEARKQSEEKMRKEIEELTEDRRRVTEEMKERLAKMESLLEELIKQ